MEDRGDLHGEEPGSISPTPENLDELPPVPDWALGVFWPPPFGFSSGMLADLADKQRAVLPEQDIAISGKGESGEHGEIDPPSPQSEIAHDAALRMSEVPHSSSSATDSSPLSTFSQPQGESESSDQGKGKAAVRSKPPSVFLPYQEALFYFPAEEPDRFFRRAIFQFMSTLSEEPPEAVQEEEEEDI